MIDAVKKVFIGITRKMCIEFGLVAILLTIFLSIYQKQSYFVIWAFILTLITLLIPILFYPFAALWFWLGKVLSFIGSRVFLTIIFFIIVTPMGQIRRLLKRDSLKINQFKKSTESVMTDRDHLYTADDFKDTF
jgi:predicted membrane chloride channel (bestrophin family)